MSRSRSVWANVHWNQFFTNVSRLLKETSIPSLPQVYDEDGWRKRSNSTTEFPIPFLLEQQLADDFAFIGAFKDGVEAVTAAAVEIKSEPEGLIILLAANEGINEIVASAIKDVHNLLSRCAMLKISRVACLESIFDIVLRLNHNRIYGRLASSKYLRHYHLRGTLLPLTLRAVGHLRTAKKARSLKTQDDLETLRTELELMHNKFLLMEDLKANEDVDTLKELFKQAYSITLNGTSLIQRLKNIGLDTKIVNSKEIRQLNKLANYWRIGESLVRTCRAYRKYFSNTDLQTLIPYKHSFLLGKRRFVHAKAQILIHLDAREENTRPRVIGVSKEACFLCDSFVLSHGGFFVSKAHKTIYEQWTIPERHDYYPSTLNRIQLALAKVNTRIVQATIDARAATAKYAFPNQSSINLISVCMRNPSMSTILSTGSRENTRSEMRKQIAVSEEKDSAMTNYASTPIDSGERIEQRGTMIPHEHDGESSSYDREEILIIQSDVPSTSSTSARSPGANERTGKLLYDGLLEAAGLCVDHRDKGMNLPTSSLSVLGISVFSSSGSVKHRSRRHWFDSPS